VSVPAQDVAIAPAGVSDLYAETLTGASTTSGTFVAVPGLTFDLPAATSSNKFAIVTLNMPNTYLSGTPTSGPLGGEVAIVLSGVTDVAIAQVSNEVAGSSLSPRHNATVVAKISLLSGVQSVTAEWRTVRGGTLNNDTFASMSAILTAN
jgi:hypothetical protein